MISPHTIGIKKSSHAVLTVREFVEYYPEQISEVWCRKLLRHLLHALERQHALHLPHRAVTPDTVCFDENGTPRLQASFASDARSDIGADLTALARVVHYAITREIVPARPLRGRGLAGYSDSIMTVIDRSLAADPVRRPHSIGELRDLLGIVVCPRLPASAAPVPSLQAYPLEALAPRMARAPPRPLRKRRQILAWAGSGLAMLALVGMAWLAMLRRSSTVDLPVLVPALAQSRAALRAPPPPPQAPWATATPLPEPALSAANDATVMVGATRAGTGSTASAEGSRQADMNGASTATGGTPAPGRHARARDSRRRAAAAASAPAATAAASTVSTPSVTAASTAASAASTMTAAAPPPASSPAAASLAIPAPAPVSAAPEDAASMPAAVLSEAAKEGAAHAARPAARSPGAASGAVFTLQIRPWGVVHVDGVRRGVSPPIKQLILAPGRHAILVTNPASRDRTLEVDTARGDRRIAVDFDGEPQ